MLVNKMKHRIANARCSSSIKARHLASRNAQQLGLNEDEFPS